LEEEDISRADPTEPVVGEGSALGRKGGAGRDDLEEKDILLSGFSSTLADHSEIESQLVDILEVERTESEQSCEVDADLDIGDLQEGGREGVRGAT
jgi:hypothetical protein